MRKTPELKNAEKAMRALFIAFIAERENGKIPFCKTPEADSPDFKFHKMATDFIEQVKATLGYDVSLEILASICKSALDEYNRDKKNSMTVEDSVSSWKFEYLVMMNDFYTKHKIS